MLVCSFFLVTQAGKRKALPPLPPRARGVMTGARASYEPCSPEGMWVRKSAWGGERARTDELGSQGSTPNLGVQDLGIPREGTMRTDECEFLGSWSQCLDSFLFSLSGQLSEGGWFVVREWHEEWWRTGGLAPQDWEGLLPLGESGKVSIAFALSIAAWGFSLVAKGRMGTFWPSGHFYVQVTD